MARFAFADQDELDEDDLPGDWGDEDDDEEGDDDGWDEDEEIDRDRQSDE